MRLWHKDLISVLPRQQLLGQHRECCALRGKGWGKNHATVNYVFTHPFSWLFGYHLRVMSEMMVRGYRVGMEWYNPYYRGKQIGCDHLMQIDPYWQAYPEHNDAYLHECRENLRGKGITLSGGDEL